MAMALWITNNVDRYESISNNNNNHTKSDTENDNNAYNNIDPYITDTNTYHQDHRHQNIFAQTAMSSDIFSTNIEILYVFIITTLT